MRTAIVLVAFLPLAFGAAQAKERIYGDDALSGMSEKQKVEFCGKRKKENYRNVAPLVIDMCTIALQDAEGKPLVKGEACNEQSCIYKLQCPPKKQTCEGSGMTLRFLEGAKPGAEEGMRAVLTDRQGRKTVFSDWCAEGLCADYTYVSGPEKRLRLLSASPGWIVKAPKGFQ